MTSIRGRRDFERIRSRGGRASSDGISAIALRSHPDRPARLGLAVSKRYGTAVVRNRARRRLRAAFAAAAIPTGTDVIVRPAEFSRFVAFQDLVNHLEIAVTRALARETAR